MFKLQTRSIDFRLLNYDRIENLVSKKNNKHCKRTSKRMANKTARNVFTYLKNVSVHKSITTYYYTNGNLKLQLKM